jgi:acetaldehyde dehydrogenase (acetylating)
MDQDLQSIQEARNLIEKAAEAQRVLARFSQAQVDAVVEACARAAEQAAEPLARLAVEETTYGVVADKVEKNLFSARDVYRAIKDMKTVGVIREDAEAGVVEIAVPAGVVAAIIPCTNPTSTAIYKVLVALKGRNTIVMSPHPSAVRCILETARVLHEAGQKAGAPEGCIGCLSLPTMEATRELMQHRSTAIILATGGAGLVRAAYSSGKPALGVGPGNVPAYVHTSANIPKAVADILTGKCFDNGTICSSEQHMVVDRAIANAVRAETVRQGGFFLSTDQAKALARVLIRPDFRVNSKLVGQSAERVARAAGFPVPAGTRVLVAPLEGVGREHPLSAEKLSPVLSFFVVNDWREGIDVCRRLLEFGGMGHTMAIHATDDSVIREMALALPAFRLVVNTPAPHGSIGYSTRLFPAMSLGCGTPGNNVVSDNISPMHLINIKRLAYERRPVNAAHLREAGEASAASPAPGRPHAEVASASSTAASDREIISRVVAKLLAGRRQAAGSPARASAPNAPAAGASGPSEATGSESPASANQSSNPPSLRPQEFVSESDVRLAITQGRKIVIGPRTIITPAAKDMGEASGVFVMSREPAQ